MHRNPAVVSVIIPVYGVEEYIERCARSVFEQTYEHLEIIFVNDCTPDNSIVKLQTIMDEYPHRRMQTRIINHQKNRGLAGARLTGLNAATGDYIQNIDSDDYILDKSMIGDMVSLAEQENADVTVCDLILAYADHEIHVRVNPALDPGVLLQQILTGEVHSSVCNKLIRRRLYLDYNVFPIEGVDMREDLSVMFRLLYFAKKIAYIPKPFYCYLQQFNAHSYTAEKMSLSHQKNTFELIRLLDSFFSEHPADDRTRQACRYFKAGIICAIALYGDLDYYRTEIRLFREVTVHDIITKPAASRILKIAGILLLYKVYCLTFVIRGLRKVKHYL